MDNQWQPSKCGSTCQSSAEPSVVVAPSRVSQVLSHDSSRNSMMNPSHYYNPHIAQEPSSSVHKMMTDPLFEATNINLYNPNLSVMGNSFFTLLSGPPASFSKYDSQQVLSSKPSNPSSKVHVYNSSSIECEASFVSPKLSSHNIDNHYLKSKIDATPVSDSRLGLAKPGNYHTCHGIEHMNGFSFVKAAPTCGASATPVNGHHITSGLPCVFCLHASGDLFLSGSGVLGVVCSCHGFRMSISKFSEHAGLEDINPGDAVHMDSGETIAEWRKVYFGKIGIRIPEDQHGWHWAPQGAPERVPKSAVPRPINNMDKHHSNTHNLVNQILSHQLNTRELPNAYTETSSQSNVHSFKQPDTIFSGGLFQSTPTPTYIDPIYNTKNSQNTTSIGNSSTDRVKATVASNIELRLGQPSQQSNAPAFHPSPVNHPLHLISSQPKLYNGSNRIREESKQFAKSSSIQGQNQLRFSNLGFGAYSTIMKEQEATRVIDPHPPSLRQSVSSSCGFGQDQIVPANSLNQNLKNSITLPPKLSGATDGYKSVDKGNISSSSGHGNWCQGTTPCSYVQDKCSCLVQRDTSNLEGNNSITAFGQPSQIRNTLLSASNMEKDCGLHGGFISSDKMKPNLKKNLANAFQWKDVPTKISGRCNDQKANIIDVDVNEQTCGVGRKCFDHPVDKVDLMKEQVMSNISSKCSTQASMKISNGDSCTDDAHCAKNFAVDEGSGIQKTFSDDDDDALDSASKINFKDGNQSTSRSTRSLIDELRVIDSFRLKKVHENTTTSMNTFEKDFEFGKRKRETKFKILGTSFPDSPVSSLSTGSSGQSSQSLEDVVDTTSSEELPLPSMKPKRVYEDSFEIREGKKTRSDFDLDFDFSKRKRIIRPVVCGRYGLISNGDTSKPAKIFSLGKILKTSKRCDPDPTPSGNKVIKKPPPKMLKKPRIIREGNRKSGRISSFNKDKYQIDEDTEDHTETSKDTDTSSRIERRKKIKEVRIRSLYDLITKDTISKDIASSVPEDNLNNSYGVETNKSSEDVDDTSCYVCGGLNNDEMNCLLECNRCFIRVHQACYGVSKVPKSHWCCRPCRENASNTVCVLCGYEGGLMTGAIHTTTIATTLLNEWNVCKNPIVPSMVVNSVTAGFFDSSVKQWVHMVCGLWTPGTRCPNVDTMSTFDVSGACNPEGNVVCSMCKRGGGCCIRCRVIDCVVHFHPWCAHQKGLLQSEVEGADNESVGFYGRCELHATNNNFNHNKTNSESMIRVDDKKETCARTEGYKGRKREGFRHDDDNQTKSSGCCVVRQEQVDAWNYINQQLLFKKRIQRPPQPVQDVVDSDPRKEYGRYIQSKGWKHLVVYKSGIHALGLYTSLFISQSEMVVEYIGEIVGLRVADRREREYESGKQLQYKSACYFFRIDKEHIIDATRKGGIARFVNHSCQPNCVAKVITVRGEKKVVFFAERDIYPGEEITYDYHFNNEDEAKKILCSCNSNNCRRYLN